jgi:uncharacterized protein YjiS (DUF1127 family)
MERKIMSNSSVESQALLNDRRATEPWRAALADSIKRWVAGIKNERRVRGAVNELAALDDRMLADIGLTRDDVTYAARHGRLPVRMLEGDRR